MDRNEEQFAELLVDLGDVAIETKGTMVTGLPDDTNGQRYVVGALGND